MIAIILLLIFLPFASADSPQSPTPSDELWPVLELQSVERILATGDISTSPVWSPSDDYIAVGCKSAQGGGFVRRLRLSSRKLDTVCSLQEGRHVGQMVWDPRLGIIVLDTSAPLYPDGAIRWGDSLASPIVDDVQHVNLQSPLPIYLDSDKHPWAIRDGSLVAMGSAEGLGRLVCATDLYNLCIQEDENPPTLVLSRLDGNPKAPLWKTQLPAFGTQEPYLAKYLAQFHIIDQGLVMAVVSARDSKMITDGREHYTFSKPMLLKVSVDGVKPMTRMPSAFPSLSSDSNVIAYLTVTPMRAEDVTGALMRTEAENEPLGYFGLWIEDLRTTIPLLVARSVDAVPAAWNRSRTKLAFVSGGDLYMATLRETQVPEREARRLLVTPTDEEKAIATMRSLKELGKAIAMYKADWDDEYPDVTEGRDPLETLRPYLDDTSFSIADLRRVDLSFDFPSREEVESEGYSPVERAIVQAEYYVDSAGITAVVSLYDDGHLMVEHK